MKYARVFLLVMLIFAVGGTAVGAQDFPSKATRIIVGFPPGGSVDTIARMLAQKLSELWKQPVVVDNRLGAGGTIAAEMVVKAAPDGYTLLVGDIGTNAIDKSLYPDLRYDPVKDFAHITRLVNIPLVIVVPTASPITSIQDLISRAKAKPGSLRFSSAGVGTSPHVFLEMMNQMADIKTEAIHYKGTGPAIAALLSGDVDYTASSVSSAMAQLNGGKVRLIAVTSAARIPTMRTIEPVATALPGFNAYAWHTLHAPAKTPAAIVEKINRDVAAVMRTPEVQQKMAQVALEIAVTSVEESAAFIAQQAEFWAVIVRAANMKPD